jgi:hypothetical protein
MLAVDLLFLGCREQPGLNIVFAIERRDNLSADSFCAERKRLLLETAIFSVLLNV